MKERVHLVHGQFLVESELGKGTKVFAVIPLISENPLFSADTISRTTDHVKEVV